MVGLDPDAGLNAAAVPSSPLRCIKGQEGPGMNDWLLDIDKFF